MKNLLMWFKGLFGHRDDFKDDYVCHIDITGATWVVNDLSDTREKQKWNVIWRTEDTGWYANETQVWAACEDDIKGILAKRFKLKNKKFTEFNVRKIKLLD